MSALSLLFLVVVVYRNYFARSTSIGYMVKLTNRKKLKLYLTQYELGEMTSTKWVAEQLGVSQRRFQQVYKQYCQTGQIPHIGQKMGRPKKEIKPEWKNLIKQEYEKTHCNAVYLRKTISAKHNITIPYNVVHRVLLELGYAIHEMAKQQRRRKPWIRYEREHSLSLVHTDYHYRKDALGYLCVVLDDASCKVLAAGEFDHKTAENALSVLEQAVAACGVWQPILAVVTDHGSEFYANRRDAQGFAEHRYEQFLEQQGIVHVLCGVNYSAN